jgi:hypothetical protein
LISGEIKLSTWDDAFAKAEQRLGHGLRAQSSAA